MNYREVIPLKQGLDFQLTLPGSKSITNRALLCAALAKGKSRLYGALESDDTKVMSQALKKVGVKIRKAKNYIEVIGIGGKFKKGNFKFDFHNAGTATRFLTAIMAVREGDTIITGDKRMQERPIGDLVEGLRQIGVEVEYLKNDGCPPIKITPPCHPELDLPAGRQGSGSSQSTCKRDSSSRVGMTKVKIKGNKSSQYFSALLMLGPLLNKSLKIEVIGDLVSKPYIDITISVLKAFGIKVKNNNYQSFTVKPQVYQATDYQIEGDASSASYWTSIAYLHEGKVKFTNLNKKSIQGDIKYERVLKACEQRDSSGPPRRIGMTKSKYKMLNVKCEPACRTGRSEIRNLKSEIEADMQAMPDVAMTLACTAPFCKHSIKITGLSTLRIKETDRLTALETELNKIGIQASTTKDSITINPTKRSEDPQSEAKTHKAKRRPTISTYNDHRMAMCFSVIATKIPGIVIENPECTDKTYPNFWEDLEKMYLSKKIRLGQKNLILTGMRCCGKTYYGKKIAKLLKRQFVDLDAEIEKDQKMIIPEIIKKHGWDYFRKVEHKICSFFAKASKDKSFEPAVIATGGGVVLDPGNMMALKKNGVNVFIFADISTLTERIIKKSGSRPSLTGKSAPNELQEVWHARRDLYLKYADYVWDDTSGKMAQASLQKTVVI